MLVKGDDIVVCDDGVVVFVCFLFVVFVEVFLVFNFFNCVNIVGFVFVCNGFKSFILFV